MSILDQARRGNLQSFALPRRKSSRCWTRHRGISGRRRRCFGGCDCVYLQHRPHTHVPHSRMRSIAGNL